MTLSMLRYFIAVAEAGSFTEAAAACFVSQPALSRAIANLETELGCTLIDRDGRKSVQLTPAGQVMLVEARRVLQQIEVLAQRVQRAEREGCAHVTLGYIAYGLLRTFRKATMRPLETLTAAGVRLEPVYGAAPEIKERVLSGELDCAILPENCTQDMSGCRKLFVCISPMHVLIPKTHPLFGMPSVRLEQLRDSPFVFFDPKDLPHIFARHVGLCREAGFEPRIAGYGHKIGDVADLAYQHGGVSIVSEAFRYAASQEIDIVPLEGDHRGFVMALVANRRTQNPALDQLFEQIEIGVGQKTEWIP